MLRAIGVVILLFGFFGVHTIKYRKLVALRETDRVSAENEAVRMVRNIFRKMLATAGVTIEVRGAENIPADTPVLYVGNHRSYFDILVGYYTTEGRLGFVAKKELGKLPQMRRWMGLLNCVFIDRGNIKQSLRAILEAIRNVKSGISMWIFPEGTRNRGEILDLAPFKDGSFKIAEKAGCPVVPVAILGTAEIFEKHFPTLKPSHVVITYGKPFYIKDLDPAVQKKPGETVRQMVIGMLREELAESGAEATNG